MAEPVEALTREQAVKAGRLNEYREVRHRALKNGRLQWGHGGMHYGSGADGCPANVRHHHHDAFCGLPGPAEARRAGVQIPKGGWHSRG